MRINGLIWIGVSIWISNFAAIFLAVAILCYIYSAILIQLASRRMVNFSMAGCGVYGFWLVINLGAALQTARTNRKAITIVFLIQTYISLACETTILTVVFMSRDKFVSSCVNHVIDRLVHAYQISDEAKLIMDAIQVRFKCCGYTQWHNEWWLDPKGQIKEGLNSSYAWVPKSCCLSSKRHTNCEQALPRARPSTHSDDNGVDHKEEDDFDEEDGVSKFFETGKFAAAEWYIHLHNEPCPEILMERLAEWPTYTLMHSLAVVIGKATISTAASMPIFTRKWLD